MTQERQPATPLEYARLFEGSETGKRVFEDLVQRFVRPPVTAGGIDAVLQTYERGGARKVVEFITRRINQAAGVEPLADEESDHG